MLDLSVEVSTWRRLVSQEEQDAMIGKLTRQKREAEIGYNNLDATIKETGRRLATVGTVLKDTVPGGDPKDLLSELERAGIGISKIKEMLEERTKLASLIAHCKEEIVKLGG